jgi:hypothetical protein
MMIAGAMVDPGGLHLIGLLGYAAIMLIFMPFVGWADSSAGDGLPSERREPNRISFSDVDRRHPGRGLGNLLDQRST